MQRRKLGRSGLELAPIVLGSNVFGWNVDEKTSFALLDAFVDAGTQAGNPKPSSATGSSKAANATAC